MIATLRNHDVAARKAFPCFWHVLWPSPRCCCLCRRPAGSPLKLGWQKPDITPPQGFPMAGYYHERLAEGVHDPLQAKAVVFRTGRRVGGVCGGRSDRNRSRPVPGSRDALRRRRRGFQRSTSLSRRRILTRPRTTHTTYINTLGRNRSHETSLPIRQD